jgi:hypothetical protein
MKYEFKLLYKWLKVHTKLQDETSNEGKSNVGIPPPHPFPKKAKKKKKKRGQQLQNAWVWFEHAHELFLHSKCNFLS